jgi:hypothetical protein
MPIKALSKRKEQCQTSALDSASSTTLPLTENLLASLSTTWYLPRRTSSRSHIALARALEEEPDNEDLQSGHDNHQAAFHQGEVEDPPLGAPDSAEIPVFTCAEVLLVSRDGGQLGAELEDGFFEDGRLFRGRALLGGESSGAVLVLDLKRPPS